MLKILTNYVPVVPLLLVFVVFVLIPFDYVGFLQPQKTTLPEEGQVAPVIGWVYVPRDDEFYLGG